MKNKIFYLFTFSLLSLWEIKAQEAIISSYGVGTGTGGSISYSVGQVVYKNQIGSTGSMGVGVQQPFEISGVLGVDDFLGINMSLIAYPNPTTNFLNLTITNMDYKNLFYQLYDLNGRLLAHKKLTNNSTKITMKYLPSAVYYLKIINNLKPVKIFKIIKN